MENYSRTKNTFLNLMMGLGGQVLSIIINFVCRTVFIKTLGVEYLGLNGLFADILSMLSLAELGFDTAISFRLYKPIANNEINKVQQYLKFFRRIYIIIGFVIFIAGICLIPGLRFLVKDYEHLGELGINAALIFVLFLFQNVSTYLFFAYRSIILKATQKQYVLDSIAILVSIIAGAGKIIVLLATHDFILYILFVTLTIIIQNLIQARVAEKMFPVYFVRSKEKLTHNEVVDLFKDCGALFVYKINGIVMQATDNIVLSAFIGLVIVGKYSNYLLFVSAIVGVLHAIVNSVKASLGNLFATESVNKKYQFFEIMNYASVVMYGTAAVGMALISNELIIVWLGYDFVIPQPFPILLGVQVLLTGLKDNLAQIRHVSGVFKQMWYRPIIGSSINIVVSIILVNYIGISGVIIGTIAAAIFANLAIDPQLIHKYSFNNYKPVIFYYKKNILYLILLLIVGFMDFYLCKIIIADSLLFTAILHSVICIISVPFVFFLVYNRKEECRILINTGVLMLKKLI